MSRLNKNLVMAGVTALIQNKDANFIERFSGLIVYYFKNK